MNPQKRKYDQLAARDVLYAFLISMVVTHPELSTDDTFVQTKNEVTDAFHHSGMRTYLRAGASLLLSSTESEMHKRRCFICVESDKRDTTLYFKNGEVTENHGRLCRRDGSWVSTTNSGGYQIMWNVHMPQSIHRAFIISRLRYIWLSVHRGETVPFHRNLWEHKCHLSWAGNFVRIATTHFEGLQI